MNLRFTVLAFLIAIGGCASVPMATPAEDARMKALKPPPDKALVYLYRHEGLGTAIRMDVTVDGRAAGQTATKTYMVWTMKPGIHRLHSKTEDTSELTLILHPGKRYYVWQEAKMGVLFMRSQLHLVSEQKGVADLARCKLAKQQFYTVDGVAEELPATNAGGVTATQTQTSPVH